MAEARGFQIPGEFSYLYAILAKVSLHFGDVQQAKLFLELAKAEEEVYANSPNQAKRLLQIKAELANAQNDFDTASQIYEQLFE